MIQQTSEKQRHHKHENGLRIKHYFIPTCTCKYLQYLSFHFFSNINISQALIQTCRSSQSMASLMKYCSLVSFCFFLAIFAITHVLFKRLEKLDFYDYSKYMQVSLLKPYNSKQNDTVLSFFKNIPKQSIKNMLYINFRK